MEASLTEEKHSERIFGDSHVSLVRLSEKFTWQFSVWVWHLGEWFGSFRESSMCMSQRTLGL